MQTSIRPTEFQSRATRVPIYTDQQECAGTTVLSIHGNMDLEHYADVALALHRAGGGVRPCVVLNLSGVTLLSSSGCGAMVHFSRVIRGRGGHVVLAALSRPCRQVLKMLNLMKFFVVVPSEEEALLWIRKMRVR